MSYLLDRISSWPSMAIALCLAMAAMASDAQAQNNYLVAAADGGGIANAVSYLNQSSNLNGNITQLQTNGTTPTLATLQGYDCVVIWSNNQFASPSGFGDVLADYVDGGGHLVVCTFATAQNYNIAGRLQTQNYLPLTVSGYTNGSTSIGTVQQPNHPIMQGITNIAPSNFYTYSQVDAQATQIASLSNGYPLVAVQTQFTGGVVGINHYPGQMGSNYNGHDLIANAMNWRNGATLTADATAGTATQVYANAQGTNNMGVVAGTFEIANGMGQDGELTGIEIGESGTADASAAISEMKIFRDANSDGMLDGGDVEIGTGGAFSGADGESTVMVTGTEQDFTSGQSKDYLIVCKLSGTATPGQTLDFVVSDLDVGQDTRAAGVPTTTTISGFSILAPAFTVMDESSPNTETVLIGSTNAVLHQFTISYPDGPNSEIQAIEVAFEGSGDESQAFDRVALIYDSDNDATLTPGTDSELDTQIITTNNGSVTFQLTGQDAVFSAGDTRRYWVVVDVNFTPLNGQTFGARIDGVTQAPVSTTLTGPPLPPQGVTAGIEILGNSVLATVNNANETAMIDNDASGTTGDGEVLLDLTLFATNATWDITDLTFRFSGSGDDTSAFGSFALVQDDGNGTFDGIANELNGGSVSAPLAMDDGTLTFDLLDSVFSGMIERRFFLVAPFVGGRAGETFQVSLEDASFTAPTGGVFITLPTTEGREYTINPARFEVALNGPMTATSVNNTDLAVLLGDFSISTRNDQYTVTELTFTASGSGDDAAAFSELTLYEDTDGSGAFEFSNDTIATMVSAQGFPADNGDYVATLTDTDFNGPTDRRFFLVVSLNGSALANQTFDVALTGMTATQPSGFVSSDIPTAASTALIIDTPVVTVRNANNAPIATGREAGEDFGYVLAAYSFTTSNGGAQVNGFDLLTAGTANWVSDLSATNGVEIYLDADQSGTFDAASDTLLGSAGGMVGSMGFTFSSPIVIPNAETRTVFVVVNVLAGIGASVEQSVHTLNVRINNASDITLDNPGTRVLFGNPAPQSSNLTVVEWSVENFDPLRSIELTGGQDIVITGSGFTAPVSVTIGGISCPGNPVINANGTEISGLRVPEALDPNYKALEIVLTTSALGDRTLDVTFNYGAASSGGGGGGGGCSLDGGSAPAWWLLLMGASVLGVALYRRRADA